MFRDLNEEETEQFQQYASQTRLMDSKVRRRHHDL
jgi:hypothetical protein